ncbi:MAG: hypothetical protein JO121_25260 [Deltaproteobacteria bacterium]|nr:hypothetical protein [Deltaproteobacteria bacterium]
MARVVVEASVPNPMRDGVGLFADLYRPSLSGQYPVLLQRTPYDKGAGGALFLDAFRAPQQNYAMVIHDARGRCSSGGEFAS